MTDQYDRDLILALIIQPAAYSVEVLGALAIYRKEDGRFVVAGAAEGTRTFQHAGDAVEYFLLRKNAREQP